MRRWLVFPVVAPGPKMAGFSSRWIGNFVPLEPTYAAVTTIPRVVSALVLTIKFLSR